MGMLRGPGLKRTLIRGNQRALTSTFPHANNDTHVIPRRIEGPGVGVDNLLLEDGDNLLLEDGCVLLLE